MSDNDKEALLNGTAAIQTKIEIIVEDDDNIILTEENSVISWNHEDFRYVKDEGFIGQFVARQVTGTLKNISDDFVMTDKEFILWLGVKVNDNTTWYSLGNFLVTKAEDDEVNDKTNFEALDYTKKFNKVYEDTITYPCTALQLAQNVCNQCGVILETTNFLNNDYIIEGNVFVNNESCRDVMKAIGKLAFSWVRVDWDNKVYIDFNVPNEISEYNVITNHEYYNLKTQKEQFGVVNKVVIGYSQIEGERTYIDDPDSISENGECALTIYDNPLVYTQEQRERIINSASYLFGLYYSPLNTQTIGHPWLKGNELIQIVDMEGNFYNTIPFDRTIQYFGHIKTLINVATDTKTDNILAYNSGISKDLATLTEITVNKMNSQITEIIEETLDENNPTSIATRLSESIRDLDSLKNIFQITGGSNLIKNSQFLLSDESWEFTTPITDYNLIYTDGSTEYGIINEEDTVKYSISLDPSLTYHTPLGQGYDSSLIGLTVANAKIKLRNISINTKNDNINNLVIGKTYTLNYAYKQDSLTTTNIELIDNITNEIIYSKAYNTENNSILYDDFQFVARNTEYIFRVTTNTTSNDGGYFHLYDLMLNSGDKKTWEPATSEVYSTVLQMSRLGLQVKSTGANITTLLNAEGLNIYKGQDISGEPITKFDEEGLKTGTADMDIADIDSYIMKTITIGGNRHHIEYFGGE